MLTCIEVLAQGSAYLEGDLSPAGRRSLRLHLLLCLHCRKYIRALALTRQTVRELPVPADEQRVGRILSLIPPAG
jgi:hypothetical protein